MTEAPPRSVSRFINEMDYARLNAERANAELVAGIPELKIAEEHARYRAALERIAALPAWRATESRNAAQLALYPQD